MFRFRLDIIGNSLSSHPFEKFWYLCSYDIPWVVLCP